MTGARRSPCSRTPATTRKRATGSGNAAIAAARLGCTAVGVDYVPELLERGRIRVPAEGLAIELLEGDAEALPFADESFDAVTSVFGSMFAPNHQQAASELLRVCRSGGTIALASWTPDGFIGELFKTVGSYVPPPAGVQSPLLWATEASPGPSPRRRHRVARGRGRIFTYRFPSAEDFVAFFRSGYGPTVKAFAALDENDRRRARARSRCVGGALRQAGHRRGGNPGRLHRGNRDQGMSVSAYARLSLLPGRRRRRRRQATAASLPATTSRGGSRSAARGTSSSPSVPRSSARGHSPT